VAGSGTRPMPLISTTSAWGLATPAATTPTPTSATSLTEMRAFGMTFFEVVDELRPHLDRVNVVMRWRRDRRPTPGMEWRTRAMSRPLVPGSWPPYARLCTLGDLDLPDRRR